MDKDPPRGGKHPFPTSSPPHHLSLSPTKSISFQENLTPSPLVFSLFSSYTFLGSEFVALAAMRGLNEDGQRVGRGIAMYKWGYSVKTWLGVKSDFTWLYAERRSAMHSQTFILIIYLPISHSVVVVLVIRASFSYPLCCLAPFAMGNHLLSV